MDEQPQGVADDKPPVFRNINGWIGGITGVVLALAGLRAAYQQLVAHEPAVQTAVAGEGDAANSETAVASSEKAAAGDEGPWSYTTSTGGTLAWVDGLWVETAADGTVTNFQHLSSENGMTNASDPATGLFLRWPDAGGIVEQSEGDRTSWTDRYRITADAAEEDAPEEAAEEAPAEEESATE